MKGVITIIADTREQKPLLFPRTIRLQGGARLLKVVRSKLDLGDYAIQGAEGGCVIERKGSIAEISKNTLDGRDAARQRAAFDRLAQAAAPIILIEQSVGDLMRVNKYAEDPGLAMDILLREAMSRGIQVWFVGNCGMPSKRRMVGELVARAMVAHLEMEQNNGRKPDDAI
jgi:hypothetical protein